MNRSDDFNRANDATGLGTPSDGGPAWVRGQAQGYTVSANQAVASGSGPKTDYLDCGAADADVQATLAATASNPGLLFRYSDPANYWFVYTISNYIHICKVQAGTLSDPAFSGWNNDGVVTADGDVWKVTCDGPDIEVFRNGTSVLAKTDASGFNRTATKHGLYADAGGSPQWDDFSIAPRVTVSLAADRASVLVGNANTVTLSLTGTNTAWDGTTVFAASGVAGWSVSGQTVTDATHATVTLTRSLTTGTLTLSDGAASAVVDATDTATAVATGNLSAGATWDTLEPPSEPHRAVVPDAVAVTVGADAALGTSPSDATTNALTCTGTGSVTVADGVALTVRGNVSVENGVLQVGTGTGGGGAVLEFDASRAGTPSTAYQCVIGGNTKAGCKLVARGAGWEIRSNAGGGNAQITLADGQYDLRGTGAVTRMGDATRDALLLSLTTPAALTHTFAGIIFDAASGRLNVGNGLPAGVGFSLTDCTFKSQSHAGLYMAGGSADPEAGVTREVSGCVFWGSPRLQPNALACDDNLFLASGVTTPAFSAVGSAKFASFARNLVRGALHNSAPRWGDWSECVVLADQSDLAPDGTYSAVNDLDNPHWLTPFGSGAPAGFYDVDDCVFESFRAVGTDSYGDIDYGPNSTGYDSRFRRNLVVPDHGAAMDMSDLRNPGTLTTHNGWQSGSPASVYEHNTFFQGQQGALAMLEGPPQPSPPYGVAGQVASFQSNLLWNTAGLSAGAFNYAAYPPNTTPGSLAADLIAVAGHNRFWNVRSDGVSGFYNVPLSATVPVGDQLGDPLFADYTRHFASWVQSVEPSWAGVPAPTADQYRARGLYKLSLVNEPASADYDGRYTLGGYKTYVRAGFAPADAALKGAGHDGTDIGAVPFASPGVTDYVAGCMNDATGIANYVASF